MKISGGMIISANGNMGQLLRCLWSYRPVKHRKLELAHLETLGIGVENDKGTVRFGSFATDPSSPGRSRSPQWPES
jgi:hypothetical protein